MHGKDCNYLIMNNIIDHYETLIASVKKQPSAAVASFALTLFDFSSLQRSNRILFTFNAAIKN
jgi:hypothetical protein